MGMFNCISCEFQNFDKSIEYQTKSLGILSLSHFFIKADGTVWRQVRADKSFIQIDLDKFLYPEDCAAIPPNFGFHGGESFQDYIAIVKNNKVISIEEEKSFYEYLSTIKEYRDWCALEKIKEDKKYVELLEEYLKANPTKTIDDYKRDNNYISTILRNDSFVEKIINSSKVDHC